MCSTYVGSSFVLSLNMQISKSSWHYRLIAWSKNMDGRSSRDMPSSLCGYFWSVVGAGFLATILAIFFSIIIGGIPALLYFYFVKSDQVAGTILIVIGSAISIIVFIILLAKLHAKAEMTQYQRDSSGFLKVSYEFFKAVKNRFCPFIEYRD